MDATNAARTTGEPVPLDIDFCSVGGGKGTNEDYVLFREGVGACVADGIGGAPLGDAVARIACHSAMRILAGGKPASAAISEAQAQVMRFITDVDSPASGTSLAVIALDDQSMDASWAGDTGIFVMTREGDEPHLVFSLDHNRFPVVPPLGRDNGGRAATFTERLSNVDCFAICTDGAWRAARPENIAMLLSERETARRTAAKIVFGIQSHDDSTALVARMPAGKQTRE